MGALGMEAASWLRSSLSPSSIAYTLVDMTWALVAGEELLPLVCCAPSGLAAEIQMQAVLA